MPFNTPQQGPSGSTLRVDPDQVLQLKKDLQPIHDEVEEFLRTTELAQGVRPLGADPVSFDTADTFNTNISAALDAAWGYLNQMKNVLAALDQAASTYNLVEGTTTEIFQKDVQ